VSRPRTRFGSGSSPSSIQRRFAAWPRSARGGIGSFPAWILAFASFLAPEPDARARAEDDPVVWSGVGKPPGRRKRGPKRVAQAALVAVDPRSGEILAYIGGRSYDQSQFNRAASARRQVGSTFKPFVYLAAFERAYAEGRTDLTPATVIMDEPTTWEFNQQTWTPRNYDGEYEGAITLRRALALSRNIATIKVDSVVGPDREHRPVDAREGASDRVEHALRERRVAGVVGHTLGPLVDEAAPERAVPVPRHAHAPVLRGHEGDPEIALHVRLPPAELDHPRSADGREDLVLGIGWKCAVQRQHLHAMIAGDALDLWCGSIDLA